MESDREYIDIEVVMDWSDPGPEGMSVRPGALKVDEYMKNSVVLSSFDVRTPPVGKTTEIEFGEDGKCRIKMKIERTYAEAILEGAMFANPGFIAKKWTEKDDGTKEYEEGDLLSIGLVAKPPAESQDNGEDPGSKG